MGVWVQTSSQMDIGFVNAIYFFARHFSELHSTTVFPHCNVKVSSYFLFSKVLFTHNFVCSKYTINGGSCQKFFPPLIMNFQICHYGGNCRKCFPLLMVRFQNPPLMVEISKMFSTSTIEFSRNHP